MTTNANAASFAVARDLMDRALAATSGVRVRFRVWTGPGPCPVDKPRNLSEAKAMAERLQRACHGARAASRKANLRVFGTLGATETPDLSLDTLEALGSSGSGHKGQDPDAVRTVYDNLASWVEPLLQDRPGYPPTQIGYSLVIIKPTTDSLDIEMF